MVLRGADSRFFGGVLSIRRSKSSNPMPLGSSGGASLVCCRLGGGFDGFPDLVALKLGSVREALAFDALEDSSGALHVVEAELDPMVPAEVKLRRVALQMGLADAVERTD